MNWLLKIQYIIVEIVAMPPSCGKIMKVVLERLKFENTALV